MRTLAFYGKGGIGKTTVATNISVLFAKDGRRVLQVGCDPKHDSSYKLVAREQVRTVMGLLQVPGTQTLTREQVVMHGRMGVDCVETGGPEPGVGCAGRGITRMFEVLGEAKVLESGYDVVVYDVLGDVVCGGFAAPLRRGFAREVYVVASGEIMALYAANNICRAIVTHARNGVALAGVVANLRGSSKELATLQAFAARIGSRLLHPIPQHEAVQEAERHSRTVIEHAPDCAIAHDYTALFGEIQATTQEDCCIPRPLEDTEFEQFVLNAMVA
ncbi:MAG: AAA family ATPase [Deltaproteobacteria bacterium]|nr:AAA family ATPase [Deltaproteobacteria bacterium]